jgi:hypothetical protein
MNIFVLDYDIDQCVQYYMDRHVLKMGIEALQIISTALILRHPEYINLVERGILYRTTHVSHPATLWAAASSGNMAWLMQLAEAIFSEYTYRYGKTHACTKRLSGISGTINNEVSEPRTSHCICVPDDCKTIDPVESYRKYYCEYKQHLAKWKNRNVPVWYNLSLQGSTNA